MNIVVDASVAAKWLFDEEHTSRARSLLRVWDADMWAPDLLWAELASVVWKRHRRAEIDEATALSSMAEIRLWPIRLVSNAELAADALGWSLVLRHPPYDCIYLALAQRLGARLVTADAKFRSVLAASAAADRLLWIEELQ
ncbi:MAG: type II toxin-antitoxin system VapC family toxin [Geminicoccaceae bacterium]